MATTNKKTSFKTNMWVWESYLPTPRSRKLRYREEQKEFEFSVRVVERADAPVAMVCSDYSHTENGQTEIRFYNKKFYMRELIYHNKLNKRIYMVIDDIPDMVSCHAWMPSSEQSDCIAVQKAVNKSARNYIIIDDEVWVVCGEPRYVVNTFGFGNNHGGTGLFVEHFDNENIVGRNYFSALNGDEAVAYANEVAKGRGDTNDVGKFHNMIDVKMPDVVRYKVKSKRGSRQQEILENVLIDWGATTEVTEALMSAFVG